MRNEADIRRVHDLLGNLIKGDVPVQADKRIMHAMHKSYATLCWVLDCGSPHGHAVDEFFRLIYQQVRDAGYDLPHAVNPSTS